MLYIVDRRIVVVEGGSVLYHVKREGGEIVRSVGDKAREHVQILCENVGV